MSSDQSKPNRLGVWGDSMMGKLPASSRRNRKRQASKRRRAKLRREQKDA